MPKSNKFKSTEWFNFKCEKCDIDKKFKTEKERDKCMIRHQKFCSCKNLIHELVETTDGNITKVSIL